MNTYQIKQLSLKWGAIATLLAAIAFVLNWYVLEGGLQGYKIIVFPGNCFLALFTEELDFNVKFVLLLIGQFIVTALFTFLTVFIERKFDTNLFKKR
ncbi:MAG: hypothetical protein HWE10_08965 [Gammaproteobacteria bacterium]|nr:hypothetical protein [Gammaproteobacteria bacterium]